MTEPSNSEHTSSLIADERKQMVRSFMLWFGIPMFLLIFLPPITFSLFAKFESGLCILTFASPLGLFLYYRLRSFLENVFSEKKRTSIAAVFAIVFCLVTLISVVAVNVGMDKSPAEITTVLVASKYYQSQSRKTQYFADIVRPESIHPLLSFSNKEGIHISLYEYEAIIPHVTTIDLITHKGYLGFPWYKTVFHMK